MFAPRIAPKLLAELARLDDQRVPIAEVSRRVGAAAERLGVPRPSYQRVRELVHELRRARSGSTTTTEILADIALRVRPPAVLIDRVSGVRVPALRRGKQHCVTCRSCGGRSAVDEQAVDRP